MSGISDYAVVYDITSEETRALTEEQRKILKQCLWDLNLTPEEFLALIEGKSTRKWPERAFYVARLLESVNWFKIVKILDPGVLCEVWGEARRYVRFKEIKKGMDFACRIEVVDRFIPCPFVS